MVKNLSGIRHPTFGTLSNNMKNASSLYSFKSFLSEWAPSCTCGFCILCKVT